jgi:hypothetical protein
LLEEYELLVDDNIFNMQGVKEPGRNGGNRGVKNKKDGKKKRHPIAEIALFRKRLKEWIKTSTL